MARPLSPGRSLVRLLEESAAPLYALDDERRIVFASASLARWLGVDPDALLGLKCDYHASGEGPLAAVAAGLAPPPEAFAGSAEKGLVSRPATSEQPAERRGARFVPIAGESDAALLLVLVLAGTSEEHAPPAGATSPERLHALLVELRSRLGERFHSSQLIGQSDAIRRIREQVRIAVQSNSRVLVVGPPGTGREHIARTVHYGHGSAASAPPLVPIACPLVDAEQMQATLADLLRRQHAAPGARPAAALLLDVDRLRPEAQQELAGFFLLPGVELHTLATSRWPLQRLAAKGRFRRDLAFALSTLTITLPPLKSRPDDIPLLAQHFLEATNAGAARQLSGFHSAAMDLLVALPWAGNLDELRQAVHEACQRASGPLVVAADLPDWVHLAAQAAERPHRASEAIRLDDFLAEVETELLQRALRAARGNKSKAAQLLGINRARLIRRLAQLGLAPAPAADASDEPVVFEPLPEQT